MKQFFQYLTAVTIILGTSAVAASPLYLITNNTTDVASNAYVGGVRPSTHPTLPRSQGKVHWAVVRMACYNHNKNGKCSALIKMATNTANPVDLGVMTIDIETGEITPAEGLHANGYRLVVNGPGNTTLSVE